jgi:membrane dipeptidase
MQKLLFFITILSTLNSYTQSPSKLHRKAILVDTHNDVLSSQVLEGKDINQRLSDSHSDLYRWEKGGVDVQFFSVWTDKVPRNKEGFYKDALEEIDSLQRIILRNPSRMTYAENYREVKRRSHQNKLVALIGVEGGHMIEDDMSKLDALYEKGMRYLTLTWNNSTSWATSAMDETFNADKLNHKGLTDFGKQVVKRLNELGVIVDLSHVGEQTFYDAIAITSKPVILSHSSVWSICPVFRNVKDDQIKAVAKNGGVVCINFYSGFISNEYNQQSVNIGVTKKKVFQDSLYNLSIDSVKVTTAWEKYYNDELQKFRPALSQMVDHIDYIVKLVGDEYVGIGSDYDGVNSVPIGLEDVSTYPKITEELLKRGYSSNSIKKILGGNVLRVMKVNFK